MPRLRVLLASAVLALAGAAAAAPTAGPDLATPSAEPSVVGLHDLSALLAGPPPVQTVARPAAPAPPKVVQRGTSHLSVVPGRSARSGDGPLRRYEVLVEGGLHVDPKEFAQAVERTLADPRSWGHAGVRSFQRTDTGDADLTVVLASPQTTDALCAPMDTYGPLSCSTGSRAVSNARRWLTGASSYKGHLDGYRAYVLNHEVGHALGKHHADCPGAGEPAPVMMQQTLGVGACRPSPWPYP